MAAAKGSLEPPLSPREVAALRSIQATEDLPEEYQLLAKRNSLTMFFAADPDRMRSIAPSISVQEVPSPKGSSPAIWRVDVEMEGVTCVNPPMRRAEALRRPRRRLAARARTMDGYRPPWMKGSIRPRTRKPPARPILRGREGKSYRPLEVFADDSRQLLTDTSWPWSCIGKVEFGDDESTGSASGALAGETFIITAKHAIPRGPNAWMKFTALYWDGQSRLGKGFWAYATQAAWYEEEDDLDYRVSHDYAVVQLSIAMGRLLGYFATNEFDDDWRGLRVFSGVGYPGDMFGAQRPVVQYNWSMEDDYEDDDGQTLETEASLDHGQSGGPFFAWWPGGDPRIVGVVAGGLSFNGDRDNALAGGPNMNDLVGWARSNWD